MQILAIISIPGQLAIGAWEKAYRWIYSLAKDVLTIPRMPGTENGYEIVPIYQLPAI